MTGIKFPIEIKNKILMYRPVHPLIDLINDEYQRLKEVLDDNFQCVLADIDDRRKWFYEDRHKKVDMDFYIEWKFNRKWSPDYEQYLLER